MLVQKSLLTGALLLLGMTAGFAKSNNSGNVKEFGKYTVHYNTLPTDFLSPEIAKQANIVRSRNRIMLNVAVKQKAENKQQKAVAANIEVIATNLTGQLKQAKLRPIKEGKSIYYIGEFSVANQEYLNFTVKVTPEKTSKTYTVKFRKQFFTR